MDEYVCALDEVGKDQVSLAGGKGANLGELVRAGFPVPPGFVVTTRAYECFAAENSLEGEIRAGLCNREGGGEAIRSAFEKAAIPEPVSDQILARYRQLGEVPVAVRSSATAEDLPQAAFAGQQDTFLNIAGPDALLDAVRRCWASLWTDRAISYRERQGVDQESVELAVVVQRMVEADVAGVLFTANPVTGARDETVIDANPGLGEAVVSGLVTPDHYVLRKRQLGWSTVERRRGRREVIVRARAGGGMEQIEGKGTISTPALSGGALRRLAHTGKAIERHFGAPQDIEWAWADGRLFIVQARPMTALPEPPPNAGKPVQMLSAMFAEMFAVRPYPLDQTAWVPALSKAAVDPLFSLIGISVPPIGQLFTTKDNVVVQFSGNLTFRPTPGLLLAPFRLLRLAVRYDPTRWRADPLLARARARAAALDARDPRALSWQAIIATVREATALALPLAGEMRRRYYPRAILAAGALRVMLALLRRGDRFGALLSGTDSTTSEANRALEALASCVRSEPALANIFADYEPRNLLTVLEQHPEGRSFLVELNKFMDRFGHRETVLSTALQPTWKDAPEIVLGIVKGFAMTEPPREAKTPEWVAARDEVLAHPLLGFSPLRRIFLRRLSEARCLWQIREDTHFDATRILPILRRTLLELGRRLVEAHVLDAPEDVFHLTLTELEKAGENQPPPPALASELRATAMRRKELRAALEGKPVVDPRLYSQPAPAGDALLRGTAGSPGSATGPVCVIHNGSEFGKLRAGDVLVAPYTNPAWTPLFERAAAVVVDGGAAGSHAAIVAREYGIPAVMGTIEATGRLVDGQRVRVDGDHGLVFEERALRRP